MRTFLMIVLLSLAAACARHPAPAAPVAAPSPVPAAAPPPAPPAFHGVIGDPVLHCVVVGGRLEEVEVGPDSTYRGQPISRMFPLDSTYAGNASWYLETAPISVAGARYVKYGLPRVLRTADVVPVATFRGVTVFAEPAASRDRPDVVYLPTRPGCEFQAYERQGIK
jgi:hypothetical protein